MVFELPEAKDFSDHPPIVGGFNVFKQCTVMGGWSSKEGQ
jgi:hypothetical protein